MKIGPADGSLTVRTGVAGSAARMGHRLIIVVDDWSATVTLARGSPRSVRLVADLTSLRVESGSGGIKPLSDGDREAIRANALGALHADQHPRVTFESSSIRAQGAGLAVEGALTVAGNPRSLAATVELDRADGQVTAHCSVGLVQSEFGVTPYSAMLGQLRVADEVRVELDITVTTP
jgi:polyisoprenoid-binding protein YceI